MLRVRFDIQKKIQAAALLVRLEGGRVDRVRLLKLLYIADRESLAERGVPIIGGRVSAMEHGPVHSSVYAMIKADGPMKEDAEAAEEWACTFENDNHSVVLREMPDLLDLSEFEVEKLTTAWAQNKDIDTWQLAEKTHGFDEWRTIYVDGTSTTIPIEKILSAVGFSEEDIRELIEDAESHGRFQRSLERNTPCGVAS